MNRERPITVGVRLVSILLPVMLLSSGGCFRGCPEERAEFCARNGNSDCGDVTAANACGEVQTINCGKCFGDFICGGEGVPGTCADCTHPAVKKDCADGWCKIPAGCFQMGATSSDPCAELVNNIPDAKFGAEEFHEVALTYGFRMMDAEVTQEDFTALMGDNPSKNLNVPKPMPSGLPVEYVNWNRAAAYANALSVKEGYPPCYACSGTGRLVSCEAAGAFARNKIYTCPGYRLPTEAEWEYAFRAGVSWPLQTMTSNFLKEDCTSEMHPDLIPIAWCCFSDMASTHHRPVRGKTSNAWGLYDMAGNVFEWCHDWGVDKLGTAGITNPWGASTGSEKVLRGGGYNWRKALYFRASARRLATVDHTCEAVGFRLVQTLKESLQ